MSTRVVTKRRRIISQTIPAQVRRPIDKQLKVININLTAAQVNTSLITATFPATVTGIRWDLSFDNATGTVDIAVVWVLVRVKDGNQPSNLSTTAGSSLYQPEQEVIAFGTSVLQNKTGTSGPAIMHIEGSTKSMRKLMGGDQIYFCTYANITGGTLIGVVQFFDKT